MWADAKRDGRPTEYRWRPLRKFRNSIHCTTPQSLADACCWNAVQYNNNRFAAFVRDYPSVSLVCVMTTFSVVR